MRRHLGKIAVVLVCVGIVAFILSDILAGHGRRLRAFYVRPSAVMGTECELTAVAPQGRQALADRALRAAEKALRDVEVRMSTHLASTELSRLNAAAAGKIVPLSPQTVEILGVARELASATEGAFDVTCKPIIDAWKRAQNAGRQPSDGELAEARRRTGWRHVELLAKGARKRIDGARIDLGGIAKGYGIDRAAQELIDAGMTGGLVNVGGDVRCFGPRADGGLWRVGIQSPFDETLMATLALREASVCTSGNYRRFIEIGHKRYSHIYDPRTGLPAEMTPSVTVVAPTATVADAWATALSVLGADGLDLIPKGSRIEAMIVLGDADDYSVRVTEGFRRMFVTPPRRLEE